MHGFEDMQDDDLSGDQQPRPADYLEAAHRYAMRATKSKFEKRAPTDRAETLYSEDCKDCGGTGNFRSYAGRIVGQCFKCNGKGVLTFKTSPAQRSAGRASASKTRVARIMLIDEKRASFEATYPEIVAWWTNTTFEFAISLRETLAKLGELSERQLAAAKKCVASLEAKKAEQKAARDMQMATAPNVDTAALEACFAKAKANGNRRVSLTFTGVKFKPAGADSVNAGAIYVTERETDTYLGKVMNGKFLATRACDVSTSAFVAEVLNDPREAAVKYGKLTGSCCVCNRTLTDEISVQNGIGPICADKMGW